MTPRSTLIAILLAIGGGVVYHISAKSVPREASPTLVLLVAYATAFAISALAHVSFPGKSTPMASSRLLHPANLGLGLGAAMIELGYVLTYRAAWPVSITSALVNGVVAVLLIPVGLIAFGEHASATRVTGIVLCLAGIWLLRH